MQMFALATNVLHVASAMRLLRRAAVLEEHSLLRQHQNQQRPASSEVSQLQQYQNLAVDCLSQAAATLLTLASACPQMREVLREQIDVHPAIARIVALELPISIALNASVLERRWTAHTPVPSAAPGMCGSAAARDTPNTAKKGRRRRKHQPPENGGRQSQGGSLDSRQSLPASPAPQQQLTAQLESAATAIRRAGLATKGLQLEPIPAHGILDSRSADTKAAFLLPGQAGQAFAQLTEEQARLRLLMAAQALVVLTCCLGDAVCEAASAALGIVCCHTALPPALPAGACPRGSGAPSACEVPSCTGASSGAPLLLATLSDLFAAAAAAAPSAERLGRHDVCLQLRVVLKKALGGLSDAWQWMVPPPPPLLPSAQDTAAHAASDAMMRLLLEVRLVTRHNPPRIHAKHPNLCAYGLKVYRVLHASTFLLKGYCQGYRAAMLREDGSDEAWVLQTTAHLKRGC